MSNYVSSLVQRKVIGSSTIKSILIYLSDRASDDGSGIWVSKANISNDTEFSKRTVQASIKKLIEDGILIEAGIKKHQNGHTIDYSINLTRIKGLNGTRDDKQGGVQEMRASNNGVQELHPTGAGDSPQGVQELHPNLPLTIHEPSTTPLTPKGELAVLLLEFERMWGYYPRKVGKGSARKAFIKARKIATLEEIAIGMKGFVENINGTPMDKIPHAATWLNGERWLDDQTHAANRGQTSEDTMRSLGATAADDMANLFSPDQLLTNTGQEQIDGL